MAYETIEMKRGILSRLFQFERTSLPPRIYLSDLCASVFQALSEAIENTESQRTRSKDESLRNGHGVPIPTCPAFDCFIRAS